MKVRNKILVLFLTLLALPFVLSTAVSADEAVDDTPNFDEDFESYTVDGGGEQLGEKWTSSWYKKTGDFDEEGCSDKYFNVKQDPLNPENKVLYIDTFTDNQSFWFLTLKDIYVKNFELSYKMYVDYPGESPWFGITCRKPDDGRYNGVTNVQLLTRSWGADQISVDFYRCIGDSHTVLKATGENNEGAPLGYVAGQYDPNETTLNRVWLNIKIRVVDHEFRIYINDQMIGMTNCNKASANKYGYVSFVSCVNKTYIDDVHLENLDTEPFVPEGGSTTPTIQAPEMANTEYRYEGNDLEVEVSLFGEAVTELKQAATVLLSKYYTVEGDKVIISKDFLSTLSEGRKAFLISTAGGSKMFYVTIPSQKTEDPTPPVGGDQTPDVNPGDQNPSEEPKGCNGSITASLAVLLVASVGVYALKRKEEN